MPDRNTFRTVASALTLSLIIFSGCRSGEPDAVLRGVDPAAQQALVESVERGEYGHVRSLILARGRDIPVEHYFRGAHHDDLAPVYSITKSVTSLLIGVAVRRGALASPREPLTPLFPDYRQQLERDPRRAAITVEDLLTMRAGISWDEHTIPYGFPENPVERMVASPDWVGFVFAQDMATVPGTTYRYNTGASVLLGEVATRATRQSVDALASAELFAPLGIRRVLWHRGPRGVVNTGSGLSIRPVDLAAIGQMVLAGGYANTDTIVRRAWIDSMLVNRTAAPFGTRYGYQWWLLGPTGVWNEQEPVYAAIGWGGQLMLIFPTHQLVAVVTAQNFDVDPLLAAQQWVRRIEALMQGS